MKILNIIDWFIPVKCRINPDIFQKSRMLVASCLMFTALGSIYNNLYTMAGNNIGGASILIATVMMLVIAFLFKFTGSIVLCVNVFCTVFVGMNITTLFTSGGVIFSGTPWMVIPALFALLLLGKSSGWFWLIINEFFIIVAYVIEIKFMPIPSLYGDTEFQKSLLSFLHFFHYFGIIATVVFLAQIFEAGRKKS